MPCNLYWLMSRFCYGFAAVLLPCLFLAIYDEHSTHIYNCSIGFSLTFLTSLCIAYFLDLHSKSAPSTFLRKQAVLMVILIWIGASFIGAMPYFFSGILKSPVDALFESVSGFTTTGASILTPKLYDPTDDFEIAYVKKSVLDPDTSHIFYGTITPILTESGSFKEGLEAIPRAVLLWRSLTQWLGGGGIVVLFLTLLPLAGVGNKVLFQSEVTGPSKEGLTPRIKETARILWKIYLSLSLAQLVTMLWFVPQLSWFESLTLMLSTASTGGFSIYSNNVSYFNNPTLEWILIVFMILGATNFYLLFHLAKGRFHKALDIEMFLFFLILISSSIFGAWALQGKPVELLSGETLRLDWLGNLRVSFFQFTSLMTSTGFATANFDNWPMPVQALLLLTMCVGGMSGSTSGGVKVIRVYILIRYCFYRIKNLLQPETVETFKLHGHEIDPSTVSLVFVFMGLVGLSTITGTFFYILDGLDIESAFTFSCSSLNNTGQAFRLLGPKESCALLSVSSKLFACFQMILGRLEYFTLLMVMIPAFYKK